MANKNILFEIQKEIEKMTMNVGDIRKIIEDVPDKTPVIVCFTKDNWTSHDVKITFESGNEEIKDVCNEPTLIIWEGTGALRW